MHSQNNYFLCMIMPAKNVEKYVFDAVLSYISHNREDILLVIIDDHSTDNTYQICKELEQKYQSKILLKKNKLHGKVNAINYGFSLVSSYYYKFVDSDDVLKTDFWDMLKRNSMKNKSFVHPLDTVDNNLKKISTLPMPFQSTKNNRRYIRDLILLPKVAWTFKKDDIEIMFPIAEGVPFEDIWFSLCVYANDIEIVNEKSSVYLYRQHNNQTFGNLRDINEERLIFRFKRIYDALKIIENNEIFSRFKKELRSSKVISLFMLKRVSFIMLIKKSGLFTSLKHIAQRDFKNFYGVVRNFIWAIRRIKIFIEK